MTLFPDHLCDLDLVAVDLGTASWDPRKSALGGCISSTSTRWTCDVAASGSDGPHHSCYQGSSTVCAQKYSKLIQVIACLFNNSWLAASDICLYSFVTSISACFLLLHHLWGVPGKLMSSVAILSLLGPPWFITLVPWWGKQASFYVMCFSVLYN